jgi:hypothetical protein
MLPRCMKASERSAALPPGELASGKCPLGRPSVEPNIGHRHHALARCHRPAQSRPDLRGIFRRADRLERIERRREVGHELERHIDRGIRASIVAERVHDLAALDIAQRILRLERDDLVEIRERAQVLAEQRQRRAAIDVAVDVVRVELERGVEIGDGADEVVG